MTFHVALWCLMVSHGVSLGSHFSNQDLRLGPVMKKLKKFLSYIIVDQLAMTPGILLKVNLV